MEELAENPTQSPSEGTWARPVSVSPRSHWRVPSPAHHRGRPQSTGPPASSSLRFWLAEPGSRPRHSTPPSPQACVGLGNHLGSPLSSGEGGSEERPGSRGNPALSGIPLPSATEPQVPPQPPQQLVFNWWADRPAAAASARRPFCTALGPPAPD